MSGSGILTEIWTTQKVLRKSIGKAEPIQWFFQVQILSKTIIKKQKLSFLNLILIFSKQKSTEVIPMKLLRRYGAIMNRNGKESRRKGCLKQKNKKQFKIHVLIHHQHKLFAGLGQRILVNLYPFSIISKTQKNPKIEIHRINCLVYRKFTILGFY